ncbi:FkbM family methyltransferase [Acidianus sulfidivorans JP7]|uniref:FkbM family methyltransferase n=1 Tax=Acidianus sulfidivorans JP7 TaxID=619593 RepID=A0A2U9IJN1_9CREN|nr:FkbM family methyltransferase [Acidianus sulfidivorans]AWR96251.1 FkbM family methyltransferase [Acidianus sulfidivorans JP7]
MSLETKLRQFYYGLIASLNLFKNWYEVSYSFYKGKDKIFIRLKDGSEGYCDRKCVEALYSLKVKYKVNLNLHFENGKLYCNGKEVSTRTYGEILFSCTGWEKDNNLWYNTQYDVKAVVAAASFLEVFRLNDYATYSVEGREVVDIGANVGDSAIYFAKRGAKKVYAFEPLPSIYEIALKNVKVNNVDDRVVLFNAGVSDKDGVMKVPLSVDVDESIVFKPNEKGGEVEVPVYSLDRIVKEIVKDPYLLKMDCEGCEVNVILNSSDNALKSFDKIIFESHSNASKLIKRLKSLGFNCTWKEADPITLKKELSMVYCEKT